MGDVVKLYGGGGVQASRCGVSHRTVAPCSKRSSDTWPKMPREARPASTSFTAWLAIHDRRRSYERALFDALIKPLMEGNP